MLSISTLQYDIQIIFLHAVQFPQIWTIQKAHTAPRSRSQTLPAQLLLDQTLPLQTLPPGFSLGGISYSLQRDKIGAGEKHSLEKLSISKNSQDANVHLLPPPQMISPGNSISRLKRFRRKRLTTGPGEKSVSSIKIKKSRGEAVGVNLFCMFVFCLSIDVKISIY